MLATNTDAVQEKRKFSLLLLAPARTQSPMVGRVSPASIFVSTQVESRPAFWVRKNSQVLHEGLRRAQFCETPQRDRYRGRRPGSKQTSPTYTSYRPARVLPCVCELSYARDSEGRGLAAHSMYVATHRCIHALTNTRFYVRRANDFRAGGLCLLISGSSGNCRPLKTNRF